MKYKLLETGVTRRGVKLFRIVALKDIPSIGIVKGERGGLVQSEDNLSQQGDCWIDYSAVVYGQARVYEDAQIEDSVQVFGRAAVFGASIISDNALIYGNAKVSGHALVSDLARVYDNAQIYGNAQIYDDAIVYGNAVVCEYARVCGSSKVSIEALISGHAIISDYAHVSGKARINGNTNISGTSFISGKVTINQPFNFSDARIYNQEDFTILEFENFDSLASYFSGNEVVYTKTLFPDYYYYDLDEGHTVLLREEVEFILKMLLKREEYKDLKQKNLSLIALNELKMQSIKKEIVK